MLEKGAIKRSLLLKGSSSQINLKQLNLSIPYQKIQDGNFERSKGHPERGGSQNISEGCVLLGSIRQGIPKYVRFPCQGNLYQFQCLMFGLGRDMLGPVPKIFTKLLKVPMSILRRLNIPVGT